MNIVITGANRGIGYCLAKRYSEAGHRVFAVCRQASSELQTLDNSQILSGIDVSQSQDLRRMREQLDGIEVGLLINNAGIFLNELVADLGSDALEQQLQINALAPLRVSQALLSNMTNGSKIAMITSRMGSIADNSSGAYYGYRMSKAALNAGSKSLAIDLAPQGISVAVIHPGFVQTQMVGFAGDISPEQAASQISARIDELNAGNSGSFWHSNGEILPW